MVHLAVLRFGSRLCRIQIRIWVSSRHAFSKNPAPFACVIFDASGGVKGQVIAVALRFVSVLAVPPVPCPFFGGLLSFSEDAGASAGVFTDGRSSGPGGSAELFVVFCAIGAVAGAVAGSSVGHGGQLWKCVFWVWKCDPGHRLRSPVTCPR